MGKSDICINKIKLEKFLLEKISRFESYTYSDEYNKTEKHDCRIASDAYKEVLKFVFDQSDEYSTCVLNGANTYEIDGNLLFKHFSKQYPLGTSIDIVATVKDVLFKLKDFPINGAKCQEFNTIEEAIVYEIVKYLEDHDYALNKIYDIEREILLKNLM